MKIYIDVLIITNTIVTLICIETASKLGRTKIGGKRIFIAYLIGGLSALLIIPTAASYLSAVILTVIKILSYPLITLIAFSRCGIRKYIKLTVLFIVSKFVFAGLTLFIWQFSKTKIIFVRNYTFYFDISLLKLTIAVILTYALLTVFDIIKRTSARDKAYRAKYMCGNYQLSIPAVADTGNKLTDCFSNTPVVIFCCDDMYFHYGLDSPEKLSGGRFRFLPFETIQGGGLIAVTYNGTVELYDETHRYTDLRCCVGITRSNGNKDRAIFDPNILY